MIFKKDDLKYYKYYDWTAQDVVETNNINMEATFIKYDGNNTIILINYFAQKHGLKTIRDCHNIEDAIGVCPNTNSSFKEVMCWLEDDLELVINK